VRFDVNEFKFFCVFDNVCACAEQLCFTAISVCSLWCCWLHVLFLCCRAWHWKNPCTFTLRLFYTTWTRSLLFISHLRKHRLEYIWKVIQH